MSDDSSNKKKPPEARTKPRRWPKVLFFLTLLITLLIGIAQGPGLRVLLEKELRKQLDASEFIGTFRVEGSLFSGIELRDVRLTSQGIIREINVGYLTVDYQLRELIQGNYHQILTGVRGDNVELWIDIGATKESQPTTENNQVQETGSPANTPPVQFNLATIRNYVLPAQLRINHSAVRISRGSTLLWQATDMSITHGSQAEDFHITLGEFTDMDYDILSHQDIILTWAQKRAELQGLPIRHDTTVDQVIASWDYGWKPFIPKHAQAKVTWQDGTFSLNLDELKSARIQLDAGIIHLDKLAPWLNLTDQLDGEITELSLSAKDIMATPDLFNAQLSCSGQNLRWQEKHIHHLDAQAQLDSGKANIQLSSQLNQEKPNQLHIDAQLLSQTSSSWNTCWHNATSSMELSIPEPAEVAAHVAPWIETAEPISEPLDGWPIGGITLRGEAELTQQHLSKTEATLTWNTPTWAGVSAKNIQLQSSWNPDTQQANAQLTINDLLGGQVSASGSYSLSEQHYQGNLVMQSLDVAKLRPMLDLLDQPIPRAGVIDLNWTGQGNANDIESYQGKISTHLAGLEIEPEGEPSIDLNLEGHYDPGLNISIDDLQITRGKLKVKTIGQWKDAILRLETLELHDQDALLVKGSAQLPLSRDLSDLENFLRQPGDLRLNLKVDQMPLAEIYEQLPPTNDPLVKGKLTLDFDIGGTLLDPSINLTTKAQSLQLVGKEQIPLTDISLNLATKDQTIHLNGTAQPAGHKALQLKGSMPFKPKQWIDTPDSLLNETIDSSLDTKSIDLAAFTHLFPHISEIKGSFSSIIKLTGTVADPNLQGNAKLNISRITSTRQSIPNLRDIDIRLHYDKDQLTIAPSSCLVAGGKYSLQGDVNFQQPDNPIFNISLTADKALLWRDDAIIARSDASLRLNGPLEKANLSGDIGIVQSLFYKDVQIIPIGQGSSRGGNQRAKAELPSFTKPNKKSGDKLDIPAPFNAWTLNLTAQTKDDFLIRGNIAKGQIKGGLKVTGTLGNPQPEGQLVLRDGQASLPFSRLHVKEGKVFFTPQHGFDPQLSIKATSRIGSYDVAISLYGLASNPKTLMTSRPPLPENEIIFLLATGSTSDHLSDSASATGKAYQLLADSVIRSSPSRFKSIMNTIAELNEKVDVNIGASDPFTGRKYNSARVEITDRWHVVASIDLDNNTRGLVVYAIQFK